VPRANGTLTTAGRSPLPAYPQTPDGAEELPTLLRVEGFRFYFFSNEGNEPPHVHVSKGDGVAKVWLATAAVAYSEGLHAGALRRIRELVFANRAMFLNRWNEYFER